MNIKFHEFHPVVGMIQKVISGLSILFLIFACSHSYSKSLSSTDSLLNELELIEKSDENHLNILSKLAYRYLEKDLDSAFIFTKKMHTLSKDQNNTEFLIKSIRYLGDVEYEKSNYDKALQYYQDALRLTPKSGKEARQAYLLRWIGHTYEKKGMYAKAIEFHHRAEKIALARNDSTGLAFIYNGIGITYHRMGQYDKAAQQYFKSLELWDHLNDDQNKMHNLNNLGMLFINQSEYKRALEYLHQAATIYSELNKQFSYSITTSNIGIAYNNLGEYEKAMDAFNEALVIQQKFENNDNLSITYLNMGNCFMDQGQYKKALGYFTKSLASREAANQKYGIASALNALGECYLKMERYENTIENCSRAFEVSVEIGAIGQARTATKLLADAFTGLKQYDKANKFLRLNKSYSDSTLTEQKSQQINNLRIMYEVDKKEQEIKLLNKSSELQAAEIKQQKLVRNISIVILLLLLGLGVVIFRVNRLQNERKQLRMQTKLEKEKMEAQRLQELDETKSRFFANIAHEFRTPLTLILGPSEQILEEYKDQKVNESASLIRQNADKLLRMVNQMLDLSKLESGMIRLQAVKKDFIGFVKGYVGTFESLAQEKEIKIILDTGIKELKMDFDPQKCSMIINNLMSNALKFTRAFGVIKVSIREEQNDSLNPHIILEIDDNGIGISDKQLPYIFDRFYQVGDHEIRNTHGTGIGLALTKELVELHGGTISVTSAVNEGTTFKIALPQNQENSLIDNSETAPEIEKSFWRHTQSNKNHLSEAAFDKSFNRDIEHTVLIVEDNHDVRRFIVDILNNFYHIIEAENGEQGLKMATNEVPDLIISDVMMPEMDGYEYCHQVKDNEKTSHIPVIMLTAKAGMESKLEGLEVGADDYLAKPFNARELLTRIRNLIRTRKKLQLKYLQTNDPSHFGKKENNFISRLKSVIEENIEKEDFNVQDLGNALAMSRTQVHRKLKALTNQSTTQFIRQFKLEKSLELLRSQDYNISEVAYMIGFNSATYFSTCFTEQFGYPPSEVK